MRVWKNIVEDDVNMARISLLPLERCWVSPPPFFFCPFFPAGGQKAFSFSQSGVSDLAFECTSSLPYSMSVWRSPVIPDIHPVGVYIRGWAFKERVAMQWRLCERQKISEGWSLKRIRTGWAWDWDNRGIGGETLDVTLRDSPFSAHCVTYLLYCDLRVYKWSVYKWMSVGILPFLRKVICVYV